MANDEFQRPDPAASPSIRSLFAEQSPSLIASSLDLRCFSSYATFSTLSPFGSSSLFDTLMKGTTPTRNDTTPMKEIVLENLTLPPPSRPAPAARSFPRPAPRPAPAESSPSFAGLPPVGMLSSRPILHDAIQWSADNIIAVVNSNDIDLMDASGDCNDPQAASQVCCIQALPYVTPTPTLITPLSITSVRWSPPGCFHRPGCVLAVLISNGALHLYAQRQNLHGSWERLVELDADENALLSAIGWCPELVQGQSVFFTGSSTGTLNVYGINDRPELPAATLCYEAPDKAAIVLMDVSTPTVNGSFYIAIATDQNAVFILRIESAENGAASTPVLAHTMRGVSPLSVLCALRFSRATSSSLRFAAALGPTLAVVLIDSHAFTTIDSVPHEHPGMISGLIWSADGSVLITTSAAGALKAWRLDSNRLQSVNDCSALLVEEMASRDLIAYCDDEDYLNIYLKGYVGLDLSPDGLLACIPVPVVTSTVSGRSGRSSTKPDLSFGIYAVPISRDSAQFRTLLWAPIVYPSNLFRSVQTCMSSDLISALIDELELNIYDSWSFISDPERVDDVVRRLRSSTALRNALLDVNLLSKVQRDLLRDRIRTNVDRLLCIRVFQLLNQFVIDVPDPIPLTVSVMLTWAITCQISEIRQAAELLRAAIEERRLQINIENCPYCASPVDVGDLFTSKCMKGHQLQRCRSTFRAVANVSNGQCGICQGVFQRESGNRIGLDVCPVCHSHSSALRPFSL